MARSRSRLTVLAAASLLASCQPDGQDRAATNAVANVARPELPKLPAREPPLDREGLLIAVARAASAAAMGADDRQMQRELDGNFFEMRLRFACPATTAGQSPGAAFDVRYDADNRTLRLRASPDVTADSPLVAAAAGPQVEAVEGFWIERTWLLSAGCAAVPQTSSSAAPTETHPPTETQPAADTAAVEAAPSPRVGIAQFFTEADARTRRRDNRPYEATKILAAGETPSAQGYDLVLSGRLKKLQGGRVIACTGESSNKPPDCLVSAQFDRVWIERPDSGEILAEWGSG